MLKQCSRFLLPAPKGEKTKAADPAISIVQIVTIYINNIIIILAASNKAKSKVSNKGRDIVFLIITLIIMLKITIMMFWGLHWHWQHAFGLSNKIFLIQK